MTDPRPYLDNQGKASLGSNEYEISLLDILRFLKSAWKVIAFFGLIGVALATAYLAITPKQYEASAKIVMAQISTANINNNISPQESISRSRRS
jgi:uncharacterized protein involved in exopolysaccharide biosynthesis